MMCTRYAVPTGAAALVALAVTGCVTSNQVAHQQAVQHWQQVRTGATMQVVEQQLRDGRFDRARATLTEALRANPDDPRLHLLLARAAFEMRDMTAAQAAVAHARSLAPDLADADYWQGLLAQTAGQWDDAHAAYQAAFAKRSDSADYLCALLEAKLALGRPHEAVELVESRLRDFPRDARLRGLAAGAYLLQGDPDRAVAFAEQAVDLDTASTRLKENLAQVLCQAGCYDRAASVLEDLSGDRAGGRDDLRRLLAVCHLRAGRASAAMAAFEAWLAKHPDDRDAHLQLLEARLLAGQVERACAELRTLLRQHPAEPVAWELLGHACVLSGDLAQARQAYARALQHGGSEPRLQEYIRGIDAQQATPRIEQTTAQRNESTWTDAVQVVRTDDGIGRE